MAASPNRFDWVSSLVNLTQSFTSPYSAPHSSTNPSPNPSHIQSRSHSGDHASSESSLQLMMAKYNDMPCQNARLAFLLRRKEEEIMALKEALKTERESREILSIELETYKSVSNQQYNYADTKIPGTFTHSRLNLVCWEVINSTELDDRETEEKRKESKRERKQAVEEILFTKMKIGNTDVREREMMVKETSL